MSRRVNRFSRILNGSQNAQFSVMIIFLLLIFIILMILTGNDEKKPNSMSFQLKQKWNSFDSMVKLDPNVEFRNNTDLIWQIPNSPKAILFLAHGCNGKAANFWDKSEKCLNCIGLPEERLIVLHALSRKFAVLAVSSTGKCWSLKEERLVVKDIINFWIKKQKLEKLPLVALGASSGGYFVSVLAKEIKFSSIVLMIAEGLFGQMDIPLNYPPTLFVHMPKDKARNIKIEEYLVKLKKKGIDVAEVKCMEFALFSSFFSDRIPGIDRTVSIELFDFFKEMSIVDEKGFMKYDGRAIRWKEALVKSKISLLSEGLSNHVQEEMNLAFAYHEMTSLQSEEIFHWFESHMS